MYNNKEIEREQPCDPRKGCDECAEYWERMRWKGFWVDNANANKEGWTQKAFREWSKVI